MIRRENELYFDVGENKQITLTGYDWRNAVLDWGWNGNGTKGNPIYHIRIELLRFKFDWHHYGRPF